MSTQEPSWFRGKAAAVSLSVAGNSAGRVFSLRLSVLRSRHQGNNVDVTTTKLTGVHATRTMTKTTAATIMILLLLLQCLSL